MIALVTLGLILFILWDLLVLVLVKPAPRPDFLGMEREMAELRARPKVVLIDDSATTLVAKN